ncbi:hypothetical protein [Gynuella sp.]
MTNGNGNNSNSNGNENKTLRVNDEKGLQPPKNVPEMPKVKAPAAEKKN